jgi:Tfp pilus assembly protein PilZ
MKRLIIGDSRDKLLSTIEVILRHWGYRLLVSTRPEQVLAFLKESAPDLLILGAGMLDQSPALYEAVAARTQGAALPLIILGEEGHPGEFPSPHETLAVPIDIFALFKLIQKHMEKYPRKHLRLALKLPGILCREEACHLTEILSLSTVGLFIKTGFRLEPGANLSVAFPLMGMKRELELTGKILYCVHPAQENNYLQGVGIEFTGLDMETTRALEAFIEERLLGELSDKPATAGDLTREEIHSHRGEITLRLLGDKKEQRNQ